jgi:hypothetical protein
MNTSEHTAPPSAVKPHTWRFARLPVVLGTVVATVVLPAVPAHASTLKVCAHGCAYTELAPALAAAGAGDTLRVGPGTYTGGVTIDASIRLIGSGARSTLLRGGGPVLTIGTFGAKTEPTVSIRGVTITGGVTRSSPESIPFTGQSGVDAFGGGVEIPPNADLTGGATVRITNSVISGNRAAPLRTVPSGLTTCPGGECPFAWAAGGGIDSWGTLTLDHTTLSHNRVGSATGLSDLASDTTGGAIMNWLGELTVTHSVLSGNQATAAAPNGRFAESGAIQVQGGTLRLDHDRIRHNSAVLHAALPSSVDMAVYAGAIHITDGSSGVSSIANTTVSDNFLEMTNSVGYAAASSGAVHSDVALTLRHDTITDNSLRSITTGSSTGDASGDSGAGEFLVGNFLHSRLASNSVTVRSAHGDATALAGAIITHGTLRNSVVRHNRVSALSPEGNAAVFGGGVISDDLLNVVSTSVEGNRAHAGGRTGSALGGGIFASDIPDGPPEGPLVLRSSRIIGNAVTGNTRIALHGGGVYATDVRAVTDTVIRHNRPDQCYGDC